MFWWFLFRIITLIKQIFTWPNMFWLFITTQIYLFICDKWWHVTYKYWLKSTFNHFRWTKLKKNEKKIILASGTMSWNKLFFSEPIFLFDILNLPDNKSISSFFTIYKHKLVKRSKHWWMCDEFFIFIATKNVPSYISVQTKTKI